MKTSAIKYFFLSIALISFFAACDTGGESDFDGRKSIEGHSDPANTGGTWGGSQSPEDRMKNKDTTSTVKEK
jgi:hypothetical protein